MENNILLENNGYREKRVDCCYLCKHVEHDSEGNPHCFLIDKNFNAYSNVSNLGICKKFE